MNDELQNVSHTEYDVGSILFHFACVYNNISIVVKWNFKWTHVKKTTYKLYIDCLKIMLQSMNKPAVSHESAALDRDIVYAVLLF